MMTLLHQPVSSKSQTLFYIFFQSIPKPHHRKNQQNDIFSIYAIATSYTSAVHPSPRVCLCTQTPQYNTGESRPPELEERRVRIRIDVGRQKRVRERHSICRTMRPAPINFRRENIDGGRSREGRDSVRGRCGFMLLRTKILAMNLYIEVGSLSRGPFQSPSRVYI